MTVRERQAVLLDPLRHDLEATSEARLDGNLFADSIT
jgi:hypothetical protein